MSIDAEIVSPKIGVLVPPPSSISAAVVPAAVVSWGDITGKPEQFPPEPHTHTGYNEQVNFVKYNNQICVEVE